MNLIVNDGLNGQLLIHVKAKLYNPPYCVPGSVTSTLSVLASETFQKLMLYFSGVGTSFRRLKATLKNLVYSQRGLVFKCYFPSLIFNQEIQEMVTVGLQMYASVMHIVGTP